MLPSCLLTRPTQVTMVRRAAAGVTSSAGMQPWVAPEVLRTPEFVTGKVGGWVGGEGSTSMHARHKLPGFGPAPGFGAGAAPSWLTCLRLMNEAATHPPTCGGCLALCAPALPQADVYSFGVLMWELWAMKKVRMGR
jgi:hypothetical protein